MSATDVKASEPPRFIILKTPAEHYAEAERLLALAIGGFPANVLTPELVAVAQVHATLATVDPDVLWPARSLDSTADRTEDEEAAR